MRAESDLQGNHRSEAPACHHCGLPLLEEAGFCPFCERWQDESRIGRLLNRAGPPVAEARRVGGSSERVLLLIGLGVFAIVAAVSIVVAIAA
ncbi:MAG: hypothetical protein RIB67_11210 [Miltoncostaeaceae bacterium]